MSVSGIGTTHYPIAGYETRKAQRNTTGMDYTNQMCNMVQTTQMSSGTFELHISNDKDGKAIGSMCGADYSLTVYQPKDFDPANPVYKVKVWDKSGNVTERMVDVSKIDLKNCDTVEMYAYTADLKESGKGSFEDTVLKAVVAKSVKDAESRSGTWSFSEKFDWTKIVSDLMQSSYHYGDLKGYMEWKKFLGFLDN